jgi:hypothetical protein
MGRVDPPPIADLARVESTAMIAHEAIFELHRKLIGRKVSGPPRELLAESARIVLSELPHALAEAHELRAKWSEVSALDPEAAERTLQELAAGLERIEPRPAPCSNVSARLRASYGSLLEATGE